MMYTFSNLLDDEVYDSTRVMFVVGNHVVFNNMVCDTLKAMSTEGTPDIDDELSKEILAEFGMDNMESSDSGAGDMSNSVNIETFFDVIGVANVNGKWYCKTEIKSLTGKQKEKLNAYIKNPSDNGILILTSTEWKEYKDYLRNRTLRMSKHSHLIQLSYPSRETLKELVAMMFEEKGLALKKDAIETFILRMGDKYDEYEDTISLISERYNDETDTSSITKNGESAENAERRVKSSMKDLEITNKQLKGYMKGIEHYILTDFVKELTKPLSSDKTNSKKVLRIMAALTEEYGAKELIYRLIKQIDECIEFRVYINIGIIPIGINYFYNDILRDIEKLYSNMKPIKGLKRVDMYTKNKSNKEEGEIKEKEKADKTNEPTDPYNKFKNMPEWKFKRKAELAAMTSLKDWIYLKVMLEEPVMDIKVDDKLLDIKCRRALYDICTRSVLNTSRIDNIVGMDNILNNNLNKIDSVRFKEET